MCKHSVNVKYETSVCCSNSGYDRKTVLEEGIRVHTNREIWNSGASALWNQTQTGSQNAVLLDSST